MKLSHLNYSRERFEGENNFYHILYLTHCKLNDKIYIGIHSTTRINDRYLGCGITSNIINKNNNQFIKNSLRRSPLWKAVQTHTTKAFKRYDLFFFKNKEDLLQAEKVIITKEFINQSFVYNATIGGNLPPSNKGEKNGNFGNKWTQKQKDAASKYFEENRNTKGSLNSNAQETIILNIITDEILIFKCIQEAENYIGLALGTLTSLRKNNLLHVFKVKYVRLEVYPTKEEIVEIYKLIFESKYKYKHLLRHKI